MRTLNDFEVQAISGGVDPNFMKAFTLVVVGGALLITVGMGALAATYFMSN